MLDLFSYTPVKANYSSIYQSFTNMREIFHQTGRYDDSNAKLDEVIKMISMYLAFRKGWIAKFPDEYDNHIVENLQKVFSETTKLTYYHNQDGTSIFGANPSLLLRKGDESLAKTLVLLVRQAIDTALMSKELDQPFDILNESFGYFVRDNFRSNIEDAQYLTPPEAVDLMVNLALSDIEHQGKNIGDEFKVLDSTCGVGSFLSVFYHKSKSYQFFNGKKLMLFGQDKVERMIRLTKINLALFEAVEHQVTIGNSLAKDSPLSLLNGSMDLILTNPPFGAKFGLDEISKYGKDNLPIFNPLCGKLQNIDSELLFIDRNLSLLKDGGKLLIIVPDSVISANGIPALLRQQLKSKATIKAIIELPSVTFAQAGTRTKTCILYLEKGIASPNDCVFVAKSENLGFDVSTRKGVQVKIQNGENDLPIILKAYKDFANNHSPMQVFSENPSCLSIEYNTFVDNSWTPSHYSASRFNSLAEIEQSSQVDAIPLSELVEFESKKRKNEVYSTNCYFVSVLHVIGEGMLDITGIKNYQPITPGTYVFPDEILFAKINPRIPRVFVVPDWKRKTLCSSEFEVMKAKKGIDPYLISFLLLSETVQNQIKNLTSGTSASHNRIKTNELSNVMLPVPKVGTAYEKKLQLAIKEYRQVMESLYKQTLKLSEIREVFK